MDVRVEQCPVLPQNGGVQDWDADWINLRSKNHMVVQLSGNKTVQHESKQSQLSSSVNQPRCQMYYASTKRFAALQYIPTISRQTHNHAHQDHDPRVDLEERVRARLARYAVVCSEKRLPFDDSVVASECLKHRSRGRSKHLKFRNKGESKYTIASSKVRRVK